MDLKNIIGTFYLKVFKRLRPWQKPLNNEEISAQFYEIIDDYIKESQGTPIGRIFEVIRTISNITADKIPALLQPEKLNSLIDMADEIMQAHNMLRFCNLDFSELKLSNEDLITLLQRAEEIKKFIMDELMIVYNKLCYAHKFHTGELALPT